MGYTKNSIVIAAPIDKVFDLTNDIERWPELFTEYQAAKVVSREGNKIVFELTTHPEGEQPSRTWRSSRVIDRENWCVTAEREDPKFPFEYMHITWLYESVPGGTQMTWIQNFKMHPMTGWTEEQGEQSINANTPVQMAAIKQKIEGGFE